MRSLVNGVIPLKVIVQIVLQSVQVFALLGRVVATGEP